MSSKPACQTPCLCLQLLQLTWNRPFVVLACPTSPSCANVPESCQISWQSKPNLPLPSGNASGSDGQINSRGSNLDSNLKLELCSLTNECTVLSALKSLNNAEIAAYEITISTLDVPRLPGCCPLSYWQLTQRDCSSIPHQKTEKACPVLIQWGSIRELDSAVDSWVKQRQRPCKP